MTTENIPAAPDLLETLQLLTSEVTKLVKHLQDTRRLSSCFNLPALDSARAVLAKTTRADAPTQGARSTALLAWVGQDPASGQTRLHSVGTPAGVIPACTVEAPGALEQLTHPGMQLVMQFTADAMQGTQRLMRFEATEVLHEVPPTAPRH